MTKGELALLLFLPFAAAMLMVAAVFDHVRKRNKYLARKPRLILVSGLWFCSLKLDRSHTYIEYDKPLGLGPTASAAYEAWKEQR